MPSKTYTTTQALKEQLAEKMAGEITLSPEPGKTIKKWREKFKISQQALSKTLGTSASVISDYESGRRKSPGVNTVARIIEGLLAIDEERGAPVMKQYTLATASDAIYDIKEFSRGISSREFMETIQGDFILPPEEYVKVFTTHEYLHGYTVIDSLKAIIRFSSADYLKIYGWSTERALFFTGVEFGRSPMIAIRAHPMKPAMVVYVKPERVDKLAIKLAEMEGIILAITELDVDPLIERLNMLYRDYIRH